MEIKFNTGRQYTDNGQIIRAKLLDDGCVVFADDSREIDGKFRPSIPPSSEADLRRTVLSHYDHNTYDGSAESLRYLMSKS